MQGFTLLDSANHRAITSSVTGSLTLSVSGSDTAKLPLGATSLNLHDAVDNAVVPLLPKFPYLFTPAPGAGAGSN